MISPKAVIDHLQLMEREEILSCQMDDRRRKYYYLANDILVDVTLHSLQSAMIGHEETGKNAENSGPGRQSSCSQRWSRRTTSW